MRFKRKKNVRYRGSMTHGSGAKKKRRGKGNKGGSGMAGTGKRGDAKKPSVWKERYFGKYGFISKSRAKPVAAVNIGYLEEKFEQLLAGKQIVLEGSQYAVNLSSLGFDKLLGAGSVSHAFKITASYSSSGAAEKVKAAGGEVIVISKKGA